MNNINIFIFITIINYTNAINIRGHKLTVMECDPNILDECVCEHPCFIGYNSTRSCEIENCYKFDQSTGFCEKSGKDKTTALLLHGFLGAFGVGFAYVGNLLVFGITMGFWGFLCFVNCCGICFVDAEDKSSNNNVLFSMCQVLNYFIFSIGLVGIYIAGFIILSGDVIDNDDCPYK